MIKIKRMIYELKTSTANDYTVRDYQKKKYPICMVGVTGDD